MWLFDAKRQKESLGEYGSGWGWDKEYAHVFDYTQTDEDIPMRYDNTTSTTKPIITGTWIDYGSASSSEVKFPFCNTETTGGQLLTSGSQSMKNISCEPHSYNAGNYYNFSATAAGDSEPAARSICPRGWYLPDKIKETDYSYLLIAYSIDYNATSRTNQDSGLVNLPLSFLRSGYYYNGTLVYRGSYGLYRMTSQRLHFYSGGLSPTDDSTYANLGYSVRCVGR